jgi:indolepyruvate ferredoxin oxidoreductase beta subunit
MHPAVRALVERARAAFPEPAQAFILEGIRRAIDWQDPAYATLYLDRLASVQAVVGTNHAKLLSETARHLALWMTYEDTIRVAALKTRATRFERVRSEVRADGGQLLAIDEYMHPRVQEICETLPAGLGRWLQRPGWPRRLLERATRRGRVVTTSSLPGFLLLYAIAGLRRFRRASLRYAVENERIEAWLAEIVRIAAHDPALAVEIARCQRLVKGYGDTHERGWRHFGEVMGAVAKAGLGLAPATVRELREAALADEHGEALHAALRRHALA